MQEPDLYLILLAWIQMNMSHCPIHIPLTRNKDILTKYGKELLDLCISSELRIVNGQVGFDKDLLVILPIAR